MSTPTECRSNNVCSTSSAVSPMPTIIEDLVTRPAALARASTDKLRAYPAEGRTARCNRATVSMLWLKTSGRASNTVLNEASSPARSETKTSILLAGRRSRTASTVAATAAAPPSPRSSRAVIVTTTCLRPIRSAASATLAGS